MSAAWSASTAASPWIGRDWTAYLQSDGGRRFVTQATWAFVALGIAARLVRYLLCFPLWGDEAFVAANFFDGDFWRLVERPMAFHQVCPPLFLWAENAAVTLFGFNENALRLFPFVCSVATLVLFRRLACNLLSGLPLLLSVAIFSVSYYPMRHASEVKPYSSDLFVAVLLLAAAAEWLSKPERSRWIWALAALAPLSLGLSHPACFVAGGISLGMAPAMWRSRERSVRIAYVAFNVAVVAAFVAIYLAFTRHQAAAETYMNELWIDTFPPFTQPWKLPGWLLEAHTGLTFAHPVGGKRGASTATFLCCTLAVAWLLRSKTPRDRIVVAWCLATFGLHFAAATLQKYPYGGSTRFMMDVAPAICLLSGAGAALALQRLSLVPWRNGALAAGGAGLAVIGMATVVKDVTRPYKHEHELHYRDFARWFWYDKAEDAELACLHSDLNVHFSERGREWGWTALYLCNQKIYSPRHRRGDSIDLDRVSPERPLRCVLFTEPKQGRDEAQLEAWLESMLARYEQVGYEKHDFHPADLKEDERQRVEVFDFVPRTGGVLQAERRRFPIAPLR